MFQIFVDSAANLPAVTAKQYDINVISFVNLVDGKEIKMQVKPGDKVIYSKYSGRTSERNRILSGHEQGLRNQNRTDQHCCL
jgi:hypothetical protein